VTIAPHIIGQQIGAALRAYGRVVLHDYDRLNVIKPKPHDVLIGHAHPCPQSTFQRSARQPGWARRILVSPWSCDEREWGFLDGVIDECDLFLAITGDYWLSQLPHSRFARFAPKTRQVDLGLDRLRFPPIKHQFNPPGQRRYLYVGNDHPGKGLDYLNEMAGHLKEPIRWIGPSQPNAARHYLNLHAYGAKSWSDPDALALVAEHDFLILAGSFDACPTVVLEGIAWGLIPVCTPTSGYGNLNGLLPIPVGDAKAAAARLQSFQALPTATLTDLHQRGLEVLNQRFTWSRFQQSIREAVFSDDSPPLPSGRRRDWPAPYRSPRLKCLAAALKTYLPAEFIDGVNPLKRR